jgi:hypothetical protein
VFARRGLDMSVRHGSPERKPDAQSLARNCRLTAACANGKRLHLVVASGGSEWFYV